jgi:hypothetical protein
MSEKEHSQVGTEKSLHPSTASPVSDSVSDSSEAVVLEEYLHYAALQRHAESLPGHSQANDQTSEVEKIKWYNKISDYKGPNVNIDPYQKYPNIPMTPEEEERAAASRSMRLASWTSIFYLITTDILGPFNAPFAISQVGWVPGECYEIALFLKISIDVDEFAWTGIILYFVSKCITSLVYRRHVIDTYQHINI